MDGTEILIDLARRPQAAAEALRGRITPELLNAHPHHDNSIAWLIWHAAREIDEQLAHLSGGEPVWTAQKFEARFGLEVGSHEHGYGHSPAEARAIEVHDRDLLFEHFHAVIEAQVTFLQGLHASELARVVDEKWDLPVTLAARMVSMSVDAAEHVAQAAYVAGIGGKAFE